MKNDLALLLYGIEIFICFATFFLFLWWAIYKYKISDCRPTDVYVLVMLLFLFQGYMTSMHFYTRCIRQPEQWQHLPFLKSIWWETRLIPKLVIEILIFWRMIRRVYVNFFFDDQRRRNDMDGEDV